MENIPTYVKIFASIAMLGALALQAVTATKLIAKMKYEPLERALFTCALILPPAIAMAVGMSMSLIWIWTH